MTLADTFAVAVALKVTPTVVRTWASRYPEELPRRGRKDGRTLYGLEDARRLKDAMAEAERRGVPVSQVLYEWGRAAPHTAGS